MPDGKGHSIGEPPGNVGFVCEHLASKPDPQYFDKPVAWFVGKWVKLGFPVGENHRIEHMWVEVQGEGKHLWVELQGKGRHLKLELRGLLANDSIHDPSLLCGVEIQFNRNEVEAVLETEDA